MKLSLWQEITDRYRYYCISIRKTKIDPTTGRELTDIYKEYKSTSLLKRDALVKILKGKQFTMKDDFDVETEITEQEYLAIKYIMENTLTKKIQQIIAKPNFVEELATLLALENITQ